MATTLEELVVKIQADTAGLSKGMQEATKTTSASIGHIEHALEELSETGLKSMGSLGEVFSGTTGLIVGGAAGIMGGLAAIKAAFDTVFEAENIRATNYQFEVLTKNVGLSAETLREGLVDAANGLATEDQLLKVANRSLVDMGTSAQRLPEIMELARKATIVFGGDLVQNFEGIGHAIAAGQTRMLKQYGLIVDSKKAYDDFATSIGTTADMLSEHGKQAAMLNAVLDRGRSAFANVSGSVKENTTLWTQLKTTMSETGEVASVAFAKIAGPTVKSGLQGLAGFMHEVKVGMVEHFGSGTEQASAHVDHLKIRIADLKQNLTELEAIQRRQAGGDPYAFERRAKEIERIHQQILSYNTSLRQAVGDEEKMREAQGGEAEAVAQTAQSYIDLKAARDALAAEGKTLAKSAEELDPRVKLEHEIQALTEANARKLISESEFIQAKVNLQTEMQSKLDALEIAAFDKHLKTMQLLREDDSIGNADRIVQEQKALDAMLAHQDQYSLGYMTNRRKLKKDKEKVDNDVYSAEMTALSNFAVFQNAKSKELAIVGKASAIAMTTMQTYKGATSAMASAAEMGPTGLILGPIVAASYIAAGLANVAQIAGVELASGIDSVPGIGSRDNFPSILAPGERVVPSETNKDLKQFLSAQRVESSTLGAVIEKLDTIARLLASGTTIAIDGREVVTAVRNQLSGGRAFA